MLVGFHDFFEKLIQEKYVVENIRETTHGSKIQMRFQTKFCLNMLYNAMYFSKTLRKLRIFLLILGQSILSCWRRIINDDHKASCGTHGKKNLRWFKSWRYFRNLEFSFLFSSTINEVCPIFRWWMMTRQLATVFHICGCRIS